MIFSKKKKQLNSKAKSIAIMYLEMKARELEDRMNILDDAFRVESENLDYDIEKIRETIEYLLEN